MANGRVVQIDTPSELYDHPRSRHVAAFVGTMNFFDATVRRNGAEKRAEIAGLGRQLLNGSARDHADGEPILIAIRPEGLALSAGRPDHAAVAGRLQARQYLGGRQLLYVAVEGRAAPVAVAAVATRGEDPWERREGQPVWLSWGPDAMTVLDPD